MNKWFITPRGQSHPQQRLLCFSYAGGNASTYIPWAGLIPPGTELTAIQLPGRASRFNEACLTDMDTIVSNIAKAMKTLPALPCIYFGHSLGSRVAYELAKRAGALGLQAPKHLIASGSGAPHLRNNTDPIHKLPTQDFITKLQRYNGTPDTLADNEQLLALSLPVLRADFEVSETFTSKLSALDCPISAIGGTDDPHVSAEQLAGWGQLTAKGFKSYRVEGDHFFIEKNRSATLKVVNSIISSI